MAFVPPGSTLPVLRVKGDHAEAGAAIGAAMRPIIQRSARAALEVLHAQGISEATLRDRVAPGTEAASRYFPHLVAELAAWARAADVSFEVLSYLSSAGLPPRVGGCTSIAARALGGGVIVGHTEDALIPRPEELFLLDADIAGARFLALSYVHAFPGVSAAITGRRMAVLCDYLPDPDPRIGVPFDYIARAIIAQPSIEAALDLIARVPRGGAGNLLFAQGERITTVEMTSTRAAIIDAPPGASGVHANHFLDPELARAAGEPQANSLPRYARAEELTRSPLTLGGVKSILADRAYSPDSICRDLTIAAIAGDLRTGEVEVCWGEPDSAVWSRPPLALAG
jgi:hypothetical protein